MLCSTTRASLAGVWTARLIALSGKAAAWVHVQITRQSKQRQLICDPILENPDYRAKIKIRVIGSSE